MKKRVHVDPEIQERAEFEPRLPLGGPRASRGLLARLKSASRVSTRSKVRRYSTRKRGRIRAPRAMNQRVIVKGRVVKGGGKKSTQRLRAHISYLNRSGTGLNQERPEFFDATQSLTKSELSKKVSSWEPDPHHFRFIVSPERASELDLESFIRRVIETMESDLKTRLEWFATCHHNTDNPHAHVVIRGVDDKGQTLLLSRDYISHGIRDLAEREATLRLGKRTPESIEQSITKGLRDERVTFLDVQLSLLQQRSKDGVIRLPSLKSEAREWERKGRLNRLSRLSFLEELGLATRCGTSAWRLHDDVKEVLSELAKRRRIEKLVSPLLSQSEARRQELVIHKETEPLRHPVRGLVVAKEMSDELNEKRFILLSGDDGRTHYVPLGRFSEPEGFECRAGQIVTLVAPDKHGERAEQVIHRFLKKKAGVFELSAFTQHVRQAERAKEWILPEGMTVDEYSEMFRTRCETLCQAGVVRRVAEGAWEVPSDVVERASKYEELVRKQLRVSVSVESFSPLSEQVGSENAVWLDKAMFAPEEVKKTRGAYRLEVERSVTQRQTVLSERGIKVEQGVFYKLLKDDEAALERSVKQRYGGVLSLTLSQSVQGQVVGYHLLGDGYRMVVDTNDGAVVRRVGKREKQLSFGTTVVLTKTNKQVGGRRREVIVAKAVDDAKGRYQSRKRR